MNIQNFDMAIILIFGIATYIYVAFYLLKTPDPSTEFGMSLNAIMAFLLSFAASIVALCCMLLIGGIGYFVAAIIIYPLIRKIVKKIITGGNKTTNPQ